VEAPASPIPFAASVSSASTSFSLSRALAAPIALTAAPSTARSADAKGASADASCAESASELYIAWKRSRLAGGRGYSQADGCG
jgi:hypothetical protein